MSNRQTVFSLFKKKFFFHILVLFIIIISGFGIMLFFIKAKKTPPESFIEEKINLVNVLTVLSKNYPVQIRGYGIAKSSTFTSLTSEVKGKIVFVSPNLESGKIVSSNEILFKINNLNYLISLCEAELNVEQYKNILFKLKKQQNIDVLRIETLEKNKSLSFFEYNKIKRIFEKYNIGSQFDVDEAEKKYNNSCDYFSKVVKTVYMYSAQIKEARNGLKFMKSRLLLAKSNLDKCRIQVPFYSRVKISSVKMGEMVSVGQQVAVLADDKILNIEITVDSEDVIRWLQFNMDHNEIVNNAWFRKLKPVFCEIRWGGYNFDNYCTGVLSHVAEYNHNTHTVKLIIKVDFSSTFKKDFILPLVDGMFCSVTIPGKLMKNVFCLPRYVINYENNVYLFDKNGRLKTTSVIIEREERDLVYISEGLKSSDMVITTKLSDPIDGMLLKAID